MGSDSLFFIIIAICLIMSAYFSATETAFLSLNRIRMKNMADKGNKRAALVLELEEKYDNLLSTILIGNNIVNILSSSLATILFVKMTLADTLDFLKKIADNRVLSVWYVACMPGVRPLL